MLKTDDYPFLALDKRHISQRYFSLMPRLQIQDYQWYKSARQQHGVGFSIHLLLHDNTNVRYGRRGRLHRQQ